MSDTVILEGIRYISANEAASRSGFTRDYVGRLCRHGKVRAHRLSNKWYVDTESLGAFLSRPDIEDILRAEAAAGNTVERKIIRGVGAMTVRPHAHMATAMRAHKHAHARARVTRTRVALASLMLAAISLGAYGASGTQHSQHIAAAASSRTSPLDIVALSVYHSLCSLLDTCTVPTQETTHEKRMAVVATSPTATAPEPLVARTASVPKTPPVTERITERVVERVVVEAPPRTSSNTAGVTRDVLDRELQTLGDKLSKLFYGSVSASGPAVAYIASPPASGGVLNQIAITQKIDQLSGTAITNPTITNGSISGTAISASTLGVSGNTSLSTTTVGGSLTITSGTALTNPFVVNDNLGTTIFAIANDGTLTTNVASTTSSYSSLLVTGNATATNLVVLETASSSNIIATNATTTYATSTTLYSTIGHFVTGIIDSLTATVASITNLTAVNSTTTNATSTNLAVFTAPVAPYFVATSSTASVFPFASTTGLTVSGTASTTNLFVSGTLSLGSPLSQASGGTSFSTYTAGDILYADNIGTLAKLPIGDTGQVLKVQAGLPAWGIDSTGGGGGGNGYNMWATTTLNLIYPVDTAYPVAIGSNATSTTNSIFEVSGQQYISSKLGIATTSPVTALSVGGNGYITGGLGVGVYNTSAGTLQTSGNATVGGTLTIGSLSGFLKATAGAVSAQSQLALTSDVSGILPVSNGGTGWSTITTDTLLTGNGTGALATTTIGSSLTLSAGTLSLNTANANTWTALQSFSNASTTLFSNTGTAYFGGTATSTFDSAGNLSLVSNGLTVGTSQLVVSGGVVGIGTTTPGLKLDVWGAFRSHPTTNSNLEIQVPINLSDGVALRTLNDTGTAYTDMEILSSKLVVNTAGGTGNVGIGTTTPFRKLSLTAAVSTAQTAIAYDTTNNTDILTSSVGDLFLYPSGNDALINNSNLWVCTGGSGATNGCPSGAPSGFGNLIVETAVGVGSSTPFTALALGANMSITTTEKSLSDGATVAVDWKNGNQQVVTLGGNRVVTFSNYIPGSTLRLVLCQDGTGSRTITSWPAAVLWSTGSAPTLTTTANKCDVLTFLTTAATGTVRVLGSSVLNF